MRWIQLYPMEVEDILLGIDGVGSEYKVVLQEINQVNDILITVEPQKGYFGALDVLAHKILDRFKGIFNLTPPELKWFLSAQWKEERGTKSRGSWTLEENKLEG